MQLALSTRWNAGRHSSGEALLKEIIDLGFRHVELGYDLTLDLVPGVLSFVRDKTVHVDSLHNFCPVPIGAPRGHPEIYLLAAEDPHSRESAVQHTLKSIEFAAETGARCVVTHAGYVDVRRHTHDLIRLCEDGRQYDAHFEKMKIRLMMQRDKKAARFIDFLSQSLEQLLPTLRETGVTLALENLPAWEAVPSEAEVSVLCERFGRESVCYWHDFGHGQIRQELGFIGHRRWLEKLKPWTGGYHIHDAATAWADHLMPPDGKIDFTDLKPLIRTDVPLVLEPAPDTPAETVQRGAAFIRNAWDLKED